MRYVLEISLLSVAKGLKLKVRKFWRLVQTFLEVALEKLVGGSFCLNRIKSFSEFVFFEKVVFQILQLCG